MQQPFRRRRADGGADGVAVVARVLAGDIAGDADVVEAGEAVSSERRAFCRLSGKVRPMAMASPTDFIEVVSRLSAPGNFSKAKRGIFVTI